MGPTTGATIAAAEVRRLRTEFCRPGEKIAIVYFLYTAVLASLHAVPPARRVAAWLIPITLWALAVAESRFSRPWSRVARDWVALALILIGYWQVDWFASAPLLRWQHEWIGWDRVLLDEWGLRAAVESLGWIIPATLEGIYLLLYSVPPLCVGALYFYKRRDRMERFFVTFFLGTFCAYALLPHFPSEAPRIAFPGADLPQFEGIWRSVNIWLQDHLDISTSVFPSGHVAVAFASAFGILRAIPERRWVWCSFFVVAALVFTATIYCRYHYAADGLASIAIALLAWRLSEVFEQHE